MDSFNFEMNVTILAMTRNITDVDLPIVNTTKVTLLNTTSLTLVNKKNASPMNTTKEHHLLDVHDTRYDWTSSEVNLILGSFFWGYISTQILGGWLVSRFGGKMIFGVCNLMMSLLSLLTPWLADLGSVSVVISRVLMGGFDGALRTCEFELWKNWAPRHEIGFFRGVCLSGISVGAVLSTVLNAYICRQFGWTIVFYFYGVMGLLWCLFWMTLIHDSPDLHPRISIEEREYIKSNLTHSVSTSCQEKINWVKVVKSPAFWAPTVANFSYQWIGLGMATLFPAYLNNILHLEISETGVFSSFGFVLGLITYPVSGYLSDLFISREILSVKNTRKVMTSIGLFTPAVLTSMMCVTQSKLLTVVCITLSLGVAQSTMLGFSSNYIDIAPDLSAMLFAVGNSLGCSAGYFAPAVLEFISSFGENGVNSVEVWRYFYVASLSILFLGGLFFLVFAKEDTQQFSKEETLNNNAQNSADLI